MKADPPILSRIPKSGPARAPLRARDIPARKPAPLADDLATEKARLVKEQADRAARINQREAGELLPADMVEREWSGICTMLRAGLLAVPARVAQQHPGHAEIMATLDREIRAALADLAEDPL